jgi:hypothetical protein
MLQWSRRLTITAGFAILGIVLLGGCSEAPEKPDVAPEAVAESRVEEATKAPDQDANAAARARTQARIDAFTADVVASVKRSADFLAAQESMSARADVAYGVLQPNGQMLEFGGTRDFLMRRPDRLRIESISRDGDVKQFFFDGKTILIDMPGEDAYFRIERPGTSYAAMDYLVEELGAPAPLEDFTSENFGAGVEERIRSGFYVQRVMLDGHICEQLAWRTEAHDVQLWVREGEEPVPCRVVITYLNAEGHPQYAADFHDWDFAPDVDDELFAFTPPESAEQLQAQAFVRELRQDVEGK